MKDDIKKMIELATANQIDLLTANIAAPELLITTTLATITHRINQARKMQVPLALITGAHGVGKTTSLRNYATTEHLAMWECHPSYRAKHLLNDISKKFGVGTGIGWRLQTSIVLDQLIAHPSCIILDEAQRLNYEGFDLLKYLADGSKSTFVLSASPSLSKRIDRWPDIASRCSVRVQVAPMALEEFAQLHSDSRFAYETLVAIHEASDGIFRRAQWLMHHIDHGIKITLKDNPNSKLNRMSIHPDHVKSIAKEVLS
jgi:DNA transposition AAA+ family ATPase